jgi:hypothetical protein
MTKILLRMIIVKSRLPPLLHPRRAIKIRRKRRSQKRRRRRVIMMA